MLGDRSAEKVPANTKALMTRKGLKAVNVRETQVRARHKDGASEAVSVVGPSITLSSLAAHCRGQSI